MALKGGILLYSSHTDSNLVATSIVDLKIDSEHDRMASDGEFFIRSDWRQAQSRSHTLIKVRKIERCARVD